MDIYINTEKNIKSLTKHWNKDLAPEKMHIKYTIQERER